MYKGRFERGSIKFPPICVRCGVANPAQKIQLVLPYRAWWRSNPAIKAPVCTKCWFILQVQEWTSFVLMLGLGVASAYFVSTRGIVVIIQIQRRLFHTVPDWLLSRGFAEIFISGIMVGFVWLFGSFRDRFLRRGHLKVAITDYQNGWVEFAVSDPFYFEQLKNHSEVFLELAKSADD